MTTYILIAVNIATRPRSGRSSVRIPAGTRNSFFSKLSRPALWLKLSPSQGVSDFFLGGKEAGVCCSDNSPQYSVGLKMSKAIHRLSLLAFLALDSDNFTLTFLKVN